MHKPVEMRKENMRRPELRFCAAAHLFDIKEARKPQESISCGFRDPFYTYITAFSRTGSKRVYKNAFLIFPRLKLSFLI